MTRQAIYRQQQIAAGNCGRGCGRPRWGHRTMCRTCTLDMRERRQERYLAAADQQRRAAAEASA